MLVLAIGLLATTSLMLERGESELSQLKKEVAMLEQSAQDASFADVEEQTAENVDVETLSLDGENGVTIYPVEEESFMMSDLLSAFASLWK